MNNWIVAPVLVPLVAGALLLVIRSTGLGATRFLSAVATATLIPVAMGLMTIAASGEPQVYYLGDWPAPFGIVLVLDRLSALMLMLSSVLAGASLVYALGGDDTRGGDFHALFQFQLLGINGAFLTGDLFNLFVFFEILLIASYCLILHGGGPARIRAAMHFVVLNLVGSSVFLIALGVIYGTLGTLNMADLAVKVSAADAGSIGLIGVAGLLLLVVFGLKAALLPLGFWLPSAYRCATASVACLFAIMTKVGVYAILRVHTLIFIDPSGGGFSLESWLLPLALATMVLGTIGAVAASELRATVSYLVVVSVGTLLAAVGLFSRDGIAAALFYLLHSTLVTGGLFLLADLIARQRGETGARLDRSRSVHQPVLLGMLFFVGAVAVSGLPPLSGFAAKLFILQAAQASTAAVWVWGVILVSGLLVIVTLSRAGSAIFWRTEGTRGEPWPVRGHQAVSAGGLLAGAVLLMVFGARALDYSEATAEQLLRPSSYIDAVLANESVSTPASMKE
ncbi:MAG: monovalent cation/H+ antiporter subunit D [Gammaproteobacteria bacterium]|nr:MAG: monovalent cation/H+ antiporter subunit D [Gammaproteobacteria bacterium]